MSDQTPTTRRSEPDAAVNRMVAGDGEHCVHRVPLTVRCWDCSERTGDGAPVFKGGVLDEGAKLMGGDTSTLESQTPRDDLSSIGYPSKAQVETAVADVRNADLELTFGAIADAIAERAGLRPGDDVVEALVAQYGIDLTAA